MKYKSRQALMLLKRVAAAAFNPFARSRTLDTLKACRESCNRELENDESCQSLGIGVFGSNACNERDAKAL
jgi:hypothetical protein